METPILRTERLELRPPRVDDLPGMIRLVASEDVNRFLGGGAAASAHRQADRLLRNAGSWSLYGYGMFMVRLIGEPAIIGTCGVFHSWRGFGKGLDDTPEAGWIIHQDHWGKGLAQEAIRACLDWFDQTHGPRRIACMIEQGNAGSVRVAQAFGFLCYDKSIFDGATVELFERLR